MDTQKNTIPPDGIPELIAERILNELILERNEVAQAPDAEWPEEIKAERLAILDARINEAREKLAATIQAPDAKTDQESIPEIDLEDYLFQMPPPEHISTKDNAKKWAQKIGAGIEAVNALQLNEAQAAIVDAWMHTASMQIRAINAALKAKKAEKKQGTPAEDVMHRVVVFNPDTEQMEEVIVKESDIITDRLERPMPRLRKNATLHELRMFFDAFYNKVGRMNQAGVFGDDLGDGLRHIALSLKHSTGHI